MRNSYAGLEPEPDHYERSPHATLEESDMRERIAKGEITREDLSIQQRDIYREELKKARRW